MINYLLGLIICYTLFAHVLSDFNSTVEKFTNTENITLNTSKVENFVYTYQLSDGEIITKLRLFNVSAIETKFDNLCIRQITDGFHLIQLWLSNNELLDCEFTINKRSVSQLLKEFNQQISNLSDKCVENYTILSNGFDSKNKTVLTKLSHLTDYQLYRNQCHQLHKRLRTQLNIKTKRKNLQRWKRADLLVFPGTNWCGKGSNSRNFEDLGQHSFADRCCRDHDGCKYTIGPFSSKYNLFNYRFHYVSHCSCDERTFQSNVNACDKVSKQCFHWIHTYVFIEFSLFMLLIDCGLNVSSLERNNYLCFTTGLILLSISWLCPSIRPLYPIFMVKCIVPFIIALTYYRIKDKAITE